MSSTTSHQTPTYDDHTHTHTHGHCTHNHNPIRPSALAHRSRLSDALLSFLTIFMPPAVAYIKTGRSDLFLNILLTLFGWFPGMLHAWYLIILHPHQQQYLAGQEGVFYCQGPEAEAQHAQWTGREGQVGRVLSKEEPPRY